MNYKAIHSILLLEIIFLFSSRSERAIFFYYFFHSLALFLSSFSSFLVTLFLNLFLSRSSPSYCPSHPHPVPLCSWRLANVALANIPRARQAIPFYLPGPVWLSYSVCIGNECCAWIAKPLCPWLVFSMDVTSGHDGFWQCVHSISFLLLCTESLCFFYPLLTSAIKNVPFFVSVSYEENSK